MFFVALATDYDGTIAEHGVVSDETIAALERLRESGRKLILVTGRELPDLKRVFPRLDLFDRVVVENGALLYLPQGEEERVLAARPPAAFIERLREEGVEPLSVGRSIVATWEPNETAVLAAIRDLGLELQIIFNKGAVMVLPAGCNKASGLNAALLDLGLSPHNVIGCGDAENDHAFLTLCGCSVAVANALPAVKDNVDVVTQEPRGAGVVSIIDRLIEGDAKAFSAATSRHHICAGRDRAGKDVLVHPHDDTILIAGTSGGGKSTLATALLERLIDRGFQVCVLDPEGDYSEFEGVVVLGDAKNPPALSEIAELLARPNTSLAVNLLGLAVEDRPALFDKVLGQISTLRARTGRPHWVLIDEAHHMLPAKRDTVRLTLPQELPAAIFVTVHPDALSPDALARCRSVLAIGDVAPDVVRGLAAALGAEVEIDANALPVRGEALYWHAGEAEPRLVTLEPTRQAHRRHTRKYALGDLGDNRSFYFTGPDGKLNLRAQNLALFLQIGDGVDEDTWRHHLEAGHYSQWFREYIKDTALADEAAAIETDKGLDVAEARRRIRAVVETRYTAPAEKAEPSPA